MTPRLAAEIVEQETARAFEILHRMQVVEQVGVASRDRLPIVTVAA